MSDTSAPSGPLPPGPAVPNTAYRPIPLLAVAGAAVAGLYAAVVVLGGLFALLHGEPWLLPAWSAVFPIAGAGLSLAALTRVRRSDGTLGGGKLARLGLGLSVLVGASYWAYVGATYFAVGGEAEQVGLDFLTRLGGGDVPGAFRLTVPPADRPPDGPGLRDALEARFNGVSQRIPRGNLTAFAESDYVGALGRCGPETKFEPVGVEKWEYVRGGYYLRMLYRARAEGLSFDLIVTARGDQDKDSGGRRWQVVLERTGLTNDAQLVANAEWKRVAAVARQSRDYVENEFVRPLHEGKGEAAFLCTLPPAARAGARQSAGRARLGLFLASGLGPGAVAWPAPAAALASETLACDEYLAGAACLPGLDDFLGGGMVRADRNVYYAPADIRDGTIELVRSGFGRGGGRIADGLRPDLRVTVPRLRREEGRYVVEHDFALRAAQHPALYLIEGRIVVEGDAAEADRGSMLAWRVREIYLVSGKAFH
jgi:hypothetical protein